MEPLTSKYDRYPTHLGRFNKDVANHEMTVLHDDGVYRHLRFKAPETGVHWFDIVTWPGNLTVTGDMGTYQFAREPDMFTWFSPDEINPSYWAEKLAAANYGRYDGNPVRRYSKKEFKAWLMGRFWDDRQDMTGPDAAKAWRLIRETIFENWYSGNKSAPENEHEAIEKIRDLHQHYANTLSYELYDWGDAIEGWQDFTGHYLWNCHAIIAAIRDYRAHKAK